MHLKQLEVALGLPPGIGIPRCLCEMLMLSNVALENAGRDQEERTRDCMDFGLPVIDE
ncbi:hypothetical protein D3C75_1361930 [compost metagenome]